MAPGEYEICNSIWMLDDFTEENGATRVVPGSHRWGRLPRDDMADTLAPHPDEVLVLGSAGTAVVFNSHLWHGGTTNRTDKPRRVLRPGRGGGAPGPLPLRAAMGPAQLGR